MANKKKRKPAQARATAQASRGPRGDRPAARRRQHGAAGAQGAGASGRAKPNASGRPLRRVPTGRDLLRRRPGGGGRAVVVPAGGGAPPAPPGGDQRRSSAASCSEDHRVRSATRRRATRRTTVRRSPTRPAPADLRSALPGSAAAQRSPRATTEPLRRAGAVHFLEHAGVIAYYRPGEAGPGSARDRRVSRQLAQRSQRT